MRIYPNDRLRLAGFLDLPPSPNFAIPVFTNGSDIFIQHEKEGCVDFFVALGRKSAERLTPLDTMPHVPAETPSAALGEETLFAFLDEAGRPFIGGKATLANTLKIWMKKRSVNPMLALEIVEFCELSAQELAAAVLEAEQYLRRCNLPQATSWRRGEFRRLGLTQLPDQQNKPNTSNFFRSISPSPVTIPPLPLVHAADAFRFRQIIAENQLQASRNAVLQQPLVEAWYGKIGHLREIESPLTNADFPVIFILDPQLLEQASAASAIESFVYDRLSVGPLARMSYRDFALPPTKEALSSVVAHIFGNNRLYFKGELAANPVVGSFEFELQAYLGVLRGTRNQRFGGWSDGRSCTIEVHFNHDIPLDSGSLEAVILPFSFGEMQEVRSFLSRVRAEPLFYETTAGTPMVMLYPVLIEMLGKYLENRGYIDSSQQVFFPGDELA